MGCDIHLFVERKHGEKWVGVYSSDVNFRPQIQVYPKDGDTYLLPGEAGNYYCRLTNRNYEFFGALAGVRTEGPPAKGPPKDQSELTEAILEGWNFDGHSISWDTLEDFLTKYIRHNEHQIVDAVKDKLTSEKAWLARFHALTGLYLHDGEDELKEYRVVYFFDN